MYIVHTIQDYKKKSDSQWDRNLYELIVRLLLKNNLIANS